MAIQGVLTRQKCAETPHATFWTPTLDDLVPQKVIFLLGQLFPYFRLFRDFSKTDPCLVTSHIQSFSGPCPSKPPQKVSATEPIFIFSFHISSKWRYRTLFKTYFLVEFGNCKILFWPETPSPCTRIVFNNKKNTISIVCVWEKGGCR